jgi:acyl-CoA dehydrogenase
MQDNFFEDALKQLLNDKCTSSVVRAIEANPRSLDQEALWQAIERSGFADALRSEEKSGAALSLSDAFPLFMLCGQHTLPAPLAETMFVRAWLDQYKIVVPKGRISLATGAFDAAGDLVCNNVTNGQLCDWVLVAAQNPKQMTMLLPTNAATLSSVAFPLDAKLSWPAALVAGESTLEALDVRRIQACLFASQLAGALMTIFDKTLQFANDREQFGKPIGKFQAIQHQLSVMAEHVFAARMAAQIGTHSLTITPDLHRVAVAKARTSEAALEVASLSHSIHGAIGFTAEFDLQLLTRRLHLWRQAAGSESYWHTVLGDALVSSHGMALNLIRNTTDIH